MFKTHLSKIPNCFELEFKQLDDNRGWFTKTFHVELFANLGINFTMAEEYFSHSTKGVFRGLHFQTPPFAIDKIIYCANGQIVDFVVDLRKNSPTYGQWDSFDLGGNIQKAVFVPKGLAHGFYVKSETALIQCKSSGVFKSENDKAISFKSFSFAEHFSNVVLSEKDLNAISFDDFDSPFVF